MRTAFILPALFALGAIVLSSVYIVDERKQVLVLQFGQVKQVVTEPGLGFKLPFIQDVVSYEDRILGLPTQPIEVTPADDRRLVVDAFARWRIIDLCQWVWEEFRVSVSEDTVSRQLRAMGYRKLSARPRHHAQAEGAIEDFKKVSRRSWRRSQSKWMSPPT